MQAILHFSGPVAVPILQAITREAEAELRRVPGVEVEQETVTTKPGEKGEPITIGILLLAFIKGGAAVAVINVIEKALFKEKKLEVTLKLGRGKEITIKAHNLSAEERDRYSKMIEEFAATAGE